MALALTAACTGATEPKFKTITLGGCLVGTYFAYRNDNADWVELPLVIRSSATFVATYRTAIMFGSTFPSTAVFASRAELESVDCRLYPPFFELAGKVTNVADDELFAVAAGGQRQLIFPPYPPTTFKFFTDNLGPVDIVATLSAPRDHFNTSKTRRIIVRRAVASPRSGVSAFDAASTEAAPADSEMVSVDPLVAGEQAQLDVQLLTAGGTLADLPAPWPTASPFLIPVLPAALAAEGDLYRLQYGAVASGAGRYARHYFAGSSTRTVAMGPPLAQPVWLPSTGNPSIRLTRQSEYSRMALFRYAGAHSRTSTIIITADYQGGASTEWEFPWPEQLSSSAFSTWEASAFDAPLTAIMGVEVWKKDAQYRWATKTGAPAPAGSQALP